MISPVMGMGVVPALSKNPTLRAGNSLINLVRRRLLN